MSSYKFPWRPEKASVCLPQEFSEQFKGVGQDDIPIILIDENENKESVIYNTKENSIALKYLINWTNDLQPQIGEEILITPIGGQSFKISVVGRNSKASDGLYLGKKKDKYNQLASERNFILPTEDLVTHMFICGATGSGKTVLGKSVIEESARKGIPSLVVDLKGDLSSLGIIYPKYDYKDFLQWTNVSPDKREGKAKEKSQMMNDGLSEFGFNEQKISQYISKISVAVFTPKNDKGIQLAITSPLAAPVDVENMLKSNRGEVLEMIGSLTESFIRNLFAERKIGRLDKYKTFLQEIVSFCWENNIKLDGKQGLRVIQGYINEPPIEEVGGMPLDQFINTKMREELASRIAMCLSGVEQLWFDGVPLNIDYILSRPSSENGKTPVSVINISDLSFDEQMYVISQLSYSLYNWVRPKGGSGNEARILFFIDEIGGGGGKQAFYPSHPYNPASKPPLNILLRKGRAFGIGCIFATQNPGDIDYKGLSNCATWAVGRLQTERDRKKILEGISSADIFIDNIKRKLESVNFKDFLIKTKDGNVTFVKERWLVSYHETISNEDLSKINKVNIVEHFLNKAYLGIGTQG